MNAMIDPLSPPAIFFGSCWYPDHWPREQWNGDLQAMKTAGFSCVRFGESSWTCFEPKDGVFEWSFLDDVLDHLEQHGMRMLIGTPTYAPPAWLKERYPEAIARREDGSFWGSQTRQMADLTNADYRRCCDRVVEAMAVRYANDPRILGWQVDNEMLNGVKRFYGRSGEAAFQQWLKNHYVSIGALNEAWGTKFWSCQLDHFAQADLPRATPTGINPHQQADYLRFVSDLAIGFLHEQAARIRKVNPAAIVLHNWPFSPMDRPALFAGLDVIGVDHYPGFGKNVAYKKASTLNFADYRALGKPIWVVEQQAAQVGSIGNRGPATAPGENAVLALQSIAAGADAVIWFNWRTCPVAHEMLWGGLVPVWGTAGATLREAVEVVTAIAPYSAEISAAKPLAVVVRLLSHDQMLLHECEPWVLKNVGTPWDGRRTICAFGLQENQFAPSELREDSTYRVALLPHAVAMDEADVAIVGKWVKAGGTLIVGPLAGMRDKQLHLPIDQAPPGALGLITGTRITVDTVWLEPLAIRAEHGGRIEGMGRYAEALEPVDSSTQTLARFACGWLDGKPAVTVRSVGRGRVIHCGLPLDDAFLAWLWPAAALPTPEIPIRCADEDCQILTRRSESFDFHFLLNHGDSDLRLDVEPSSALCDLCTGLPVPEVLVLPARGWRILRGSRASPSE